MRVLDPGKNDFPVLSQILPSDYMSCIVCKLAQETEATCITGLAARLSSGEGRQAYSQSQGVCLRHLHKLICAGIKRDTARLLIGKAAEELKKCAEDMRGYAEKRDALRRDLITGDEKDASLRALVHIVGEKCLSMM